MVGRRYTADRADVPHRIPSCSEGVLCTPPYSNGNWGIAVTKALIGMAVFLDDEALYEEAVGFFHHGDDNASLPNYIAPSGQIQESGRDQAHCMLGVGCLAEIAEVAWNQGDDLYAALDNRIMAGCEYLAKSNLGYEASFFTWKDKTGKYSNWQVLGRAGMGEFRAVFELPYNHYVERRKLSMPYTRTVLGHIRPEGAGFTATIPASVRFFSIWARANRYPKRDGLAKTWAGPLRMEVRFGRDACGKRGDGNEIVRNVVQQEGNRLRCGPVSLSGGEDKPYAVRAQQVVASPELQCDERTRVLDVR